jgi:hypothetical protein
MFLRPSAILNLAGSYFSSAMSAPYDLRREKSTYQISTKDKDPSFSAKQTRAKDERVWAEIHECPLLGASVKCHPPRRDGRLRLQRGYEFPNLPSRRRRASPHPGRKA